MVPTSAEELRPMILEALREKCECDVEELIYICRRFPADAVFMEVDRLSRTGHVSWMYKKDGRYGVRLKPAV